MMGLWNVVNGLEPDGEVLSISIKHDGTRRTQRAVFNDRVRSYEELTTVCEGLGKKAKKYFEERGYSIISINMKDPECGVRITVMEC